MQLFKFYSDPFYFKKFTCSLLKMRFEFSRLEERYPLCTSHAGFVRLNFYVLILRAPFLVDDIESPVRRVVEDLPPAQRAWFFSLPPNTDSLPNGTSNEVDRQRVFVRNGLDLFGRSINSSSIFKLVSRVYSGSQPQRS